MRSVAGVIAEQLEYVLTGDTRGFTRIVLMRTGASTQVSNAFGLIVQSSIS
jgi:hypothetical protein